MRTLILTLATVPLLALSTACGGDGGENTEAAPSADLPKGSEPVELDPGRVHDRDRQPVLADGARHAVDAARSTRRTRRSRSSSP